MKVFAGAMFWKERKEERKKGFVCSMSRGPSLAILIVLLGLCYVIIIFMPHMELSYIPWEDFLAGHAARFLLLTGINILSPLCDFFFFLWHIALQRGTSALCLFDLEPQQ